MPARLKMFLLLIPGILATAATGFTLAKRQNSPPLTMLTGKNSEQVSQVKPAEKLVANPERARYHTIPLSRIAALQGSDPASLALDAFDDTTPTEGTRKVEVAYPHPNQALVTITQTKSMQHAVAAIRYRVELTTFGRSFLVSSPRVWEIVWAGSRMQCSPVPSKHNSTVEICQRMQQAATGAWR